MAELKSLVVNKRNILDELDALSNLTNGGLIIGSANDAAELFANQPMGSVAIMSYNRGTGFPNDNGGGIIISCKNPTTHEYGAQLILSDIGLKFRTIIANSFAAWA